MLKIRDYTEYLKKHDLRISKPYIDVFSREYSVLFHFTTGEHKKRYKTTIRFNKVPMKYVTRKPRGKRVIKDTEGAGMYQVDLSSDDTHVQLKCGCWDFRFMWEYPLFKNKGLVGTYRRYKPPHGRRVKPSPNPKGYMGFCKHLYAAMIYLTEKDWIF